MARIEEVVIPAGMTNDEVGLTFAAYLQGAGAYRNQRGAEGYGPYNPDLEGRRWQLDNSKHFWLKIEGSRAVLSCELSEQIPLVEAIAALFRVAHKTS